MMKTKLLFPTQVWQDTFDLDLDEIRAFAYHVKDKDPRGRVASNDGGWQSNDFRPPYIDQTPLASFHNRLQQMACVVAEDFGCKDFSLRVTNLWININTRGDKNHLHHHAGSLLSGVFYVKVPTCCSGDIKFVRDFSYTSMKESWGCQDNFDHFENPANELEHYITPEENNIIIFPSWLMHAVDPSSSDDDRISLSFNIQLFSDQLRDNEIYPSRKSINSNVPLSLI